MKRVVFSETIAASDLKVSRCRHIIEFMKVCEYYWPKVVYMYTKIQTRFSQNLLWRSQPKVFMKAFSYMEMKI